VIFYIIMDVYLQIFVAKPCSQGVQADNGWILPSQRNGLQA